MKTITIQIGNSDDKLTQQQWSYFVYAVGDIIRAYYGQLHFSGGSSIDTPWQNYCWVFEMEDDTLYHTAFKHQLRGIADKYKQDSIALTEGQTMFV